MARMTSRCKSPYDASEPSEVYLSRLPGKRSMVSSKSSHITQRTDARAAAAHETAKTRQGPLAIRRAYSMGRLCTCLKPSMTDKSRLVSPHNTCSSRGRRSLNHYAGFGVRNSSRSCWIRLSVAPPRWDASLACCFRVAFARNLVMMPKRRMSAPSATQLGNERRGNAQSLRLVETSESMLLLQAKWQIRGRI